MNEYLERIDIVCYNICLEKVRYNEQMKKKKRRLRKRTIYLIIAAVLLIIAAAGAGFLINNHLRLQNQQQYYEELQELARVESEAGTIIDAEEFASEEMSEVESEEASEVVDLSIYNIPEKELDFSLLQEENEHIYSWICIPETNIDYPIVQHPDEADYYLDHNLDHSVGYPGGIYTHNLNSLNFDDFNTVVYGHNMKNGTMFHDLHLFEDETFFNEHPYIYVYTESGVLVYQIFAAYEYSNIHLLLGFDLSSPEIRQIYLDNIYIAEGTNNHYNMDVPVTADDNILTLTTCIGNKPDKRYLVAAVLVADGRTE